MRAALCVTMALLAAGGARLGAQAERLAPIVLQLPASTRALGVGDVFVAGRGSEVIFYNPAMLALLPGVAASVQRYGSASTSGSVSSVFSSGPLAAGVGAQLLDYGAGAPPGTRTSLGTRGATTASSVAATFAVASQLKGVRLGAATRYVEERVGTARDGGAAFDVGAARDFFGRSTFALAVQNLGAPLSLDGQSFNLPMKATLGAAANAPPLWTYFDLAATAAVTYRRDGEWIPAAGAELTFVPLDGWAISGRVGARRVADGSGAKPLTLGAGLAFDRLGVDYGFHALDGSGASHRIGLRIR